MNKNKFHYYDGKIYQRIIDPVLMGLRKIIADNIQPASRVVDIGCGTGSLAFGLAGKCCHVTGLELSLKMSAYAERRRKEGNFKNIEFIHSDAACLAGIEDQKYDYAVMSMIIHEVPIDYREKILNEAVRIARKVIVADYSSPLPFNIHGIIARAAEFLAGAEHFSGFRSYQKNHGIRPLLEKVNLNVITEAKDKSGVFSIVSAQ